MYYRAQNKGLHPFIFTTAAPRPVTICLTATSAMIVRRSHNPIQAFIPGPVQKSSKPYSAEPYFAKLYSAKPTQGICNCAKPESDKTWNRNLLNCTLLSQNLLKHCSCHPRLFELPDILVPWVCHYNCKNGRKYGEHLWWFGPLKQKTRRKCPY